MHVQARNALAIAARDLLIVAVTCSLWWLTLQHPQASGVSVISLHVVTAALTVVVGYLVHEWGHLLGAKLGNSIVVLPASVIESPFLFRFDNVRNGRPQFIAMSLGGFIASIVLVPVLIVALPAGLLATKITLGLVGLGVLATLVIEIPEFWGVVRGGPLPQGAAFVSGDAAAKS